MLKSKMNKTRVFLLKGREDKIQHVKSVEKYGCCYWKKSHKLQLGDVCYLFLTGKGHNQIRYRLVVEDVNCKRDDSDCWNVHYEEDNDCYKLVPNAKKYDGDRLSRENLEAIGISRYVVFKKLNNEQADFLNEYF